jgi:hypothetical protein
MMHDADAHDDLGKRIVLRNQVRGDASAVGN